MGIPGIPPSSILGWEPSGNRGYYYLILAIDLIVLFLIARIINSRVGRASVAIREDELAAQSISINTFHAKVLSFVIATFFAGIAGAFFAHRCPIYQRRFLPAGRDLSHSYHVDCGRNGKLPRSGDWRRLLGHSSGRFFRFLLEYRGVVYGLIMIATILFRPEGIAGVPGIIPPRGILFLTENNQLLRSRQHESSESPIGQRCFWGWKP